jgi:D-threo-aldose 1-dehydrogenase
MTPSAIAKAPLSWPRVGLGCAALSARGADGENTARLVIARAWEQGVRLFDVAPLYGGGLAEERLGAALQGLPRADYFLCTKTGVTRPYGQDATPPGSQQRRGADVWDYSATATFASVARSLERLCTDRLDIVHLHDVDGLEDRLEGALASLGEMRTKGLVGYIGVGSNASRPVELLLRQGVIDAMLVAGRYTLLDTSAAPLFAQAASAGLRVIAGGILNSGVLALGVVPQATYDYLPLAPDKTRRVHALQAFCAQRGVSLAHAAVQFAMRNSAISTVLLGPRNVAELDQLLDACAQPLPTAFWDEWSDSGLASTTTGVEP